MSVSCPVLLLDISPYSKTLFYKINYNMFCLPVKGEMICEDCPPRGGPETDFVCDSEVLGMPLVLFNPRLGL